MTTYLRSKKMAIVELPPITSIHPEAALPSREKLEADIMVSMYGLALAVREQVERDVLLWQSLPLQALRANGRNGRYEPDLALISDRGVYRLANDPAYPNQSPQQTPGLAGYFVNCETGTIVHLRGDIDAMDDDESIVQNKELFAVIGIKTAQDRLSDFSALAVRNGLLAIINGPLPRSRSAIDEANRQAHVEREIAKRGLRSEFTRSMRLAN